LPVATLGTKSLHVHDTADVSRPSNLLPSEEPVRFPHKVPPMSLMGQSQPTESRTQLSDGCYTP